MSLERDIGATQQTYERQIRADFGDEAGDLYKLQVDYILMLEQTVAPEANFYIFVQENYPHLSAYLPQSK